MSSLDGIEKISALSRIAEIQQRIKDIENQFGGKIHGADFQTVLEKEMAKQPDILKNIKPIEEFLAENKLPPVNENAAANAKKVAAALNARNAVETFDLPEEDSGVYQTELTRRASSSRNENSSSTSTEEMIKNAAQKFGVEFELAKAVATAESNMNQDVISKAGAVGVMQLMPSTAKSLGVDPYDEEQNIEGGVKYLRQMLDKFNGNVSHAVAAYNAGPGAVKKYGGVPPYTETQNYVGRVLDFYAN